MIDAVRSAAIVRHVEHRMDATDMLRRVGLERGELVRPGARIPFASHVALLEAASEALRDDLLGLRLGCTFGISQGGLYVYIVLNSPTVRSALEDSERYSFIHNEGARWQVAESRRHVSLQYFITDAAGCGSVQQIWFALASVCNFFRQFSSRSLTPELIEVEFGPAENTAEIEQLLGGRVRYASGRNAVVFSRSSCEQPIIGSDSHLYRILTHYADQVLADRRMSTDLVDQLQDWLIKQLPEGCVSTEAAARAFGMSVRTLSRRLAERATTYGQVVAELRLRLAQRYVADQELQLSRVSYLLGYTDPGSFSRAFRQHFGCTPRAYRQRYRTTRRILREDTSASVSPAQS